MSFNCMLCLLKFLAHPREDAATDIAAAAGLGTFACATTHLVLSALLLEWLRHRCAASEDDGPPPPRALLAQLAFRGGTVGVLLAGIAEARTVVGSTLTLAEHPLAFGLMVGRERGGGVCGVWEFFAVAEQHRTIQSRRNA